MPQFHIAKAASKTGAFLQQLVAEKLREQNFEGRDNAHICYGVGYDGELPALNKNCSRYSKLEQAKILQEGLGLGALTVFQPNEKANAMEVLANSPYPLLARNIQHSKGRDIRVVVESWQFDAAVQSGAGFFTAYEPSEREFRTWVYRNRHLGTYEKVLRRPEAFKRMGRNYDNGFDFSGIDNANVPDGLKDIARAAIKALKLDFGAVDILQRPNGSYVVLEVNSAPGVSDERRKVIQQLAHRISRWMVNGCPARQE